MEANMKCPFCPDEFEDKESLQAHLGLKHAALSEMSNMMTQLGNEIERQQYPQTAAALTEVALREGKSAEDVVTMYRDILRRLMGSPI
jgi:hypothetical protein